MCGSWTQCEGAGHSVIEYGFVCSSWTQCEGAQCWLSVRELGSLDSVCTQCEGAGHSVREQDSVCGSWAQFEGAELSMREMGSMLAQCEGAGLIVYSM